jgi:hypothetical protein
MALAPRGSECVIGIGIKIGIRICGQIWLLASFVHPGPNLHARPVRSLYAWRIARMNNEDEFIPYARCSLPRVSAIPLIALNVDSPFQRHILFAVNDLMEWQNSSFQT